MITAQIIKKQYSSSLERAMVYYSVLSVTSNLNLTERQIQLLAFTAVNGTLSKGGVKEKFIEQFGSSKATIANMIHQLSKRGFLIKEKGKIKVHPQINIDFEKDIILKLSLCR